MRHLSDGQQECSREGNAKVYIAHSRVFNKTEGRLVRYPASRPSIRIEDTDISILARLRVIVAVGPFVSQNELMGTRRCSSITGSKGEKRYE